MQSKRRVAERDEWLVPLRPGRMSEHVSDEIVPDLSGRSSVLHRFDLVRMGSFYEILHSVGQCSRVPKSS